MLKDWMIKVKTAWMKIVIFEDWLKCFNNKMKIKKKKVLLLIDNAGGHNCTIEFLDSLTNVKVHFLPPNCTSVIQPLDQGIIRAFKSKYRQLIVKFMLLCAREEREYTHIKTKQAIENIIEAWKQVKKSTIINCWRKAGIINFRFSLSDKDTEEHIAISNVDEEKEFNNVYEILKSLNKYKSVFDLSKTAEEQVELDSEEPTSEI
jgi:hypothetical protein